MPRDHYDAKPGSYEVIVNGAPTGTFPTISFFMDLKRDDPVKSERDGDWFHPTTYSASRVSEICPVGEWTQSDHGYTTTFKGNLYNQSTASYVPVGSTFPPYENSLLNEAIIKAREDLLGERALNFMQNLAERQQAIDLVKDRLLAVYRGYHYARRRKWKQAFRAIGLHNHKVARRLSENVLAWNYGVAPLYDDVQNAIALWKDPKPEHFLCVKGSSKSGGLGQVRQVKDDSGYLPRLIDYSEEKFATCVMWVKPENEAEITRAALMVNNPPLLLYELTPYSFLVDWAWDIGGWLTAMGATSGWSFYSGYTMERTECQSLYRTLVSEHGHGVGYIFNNSFRQCKQFRRVRLLSFPTPGLPGFKNPLSLIHALNAVSLFGART